MHHATFFLSTGRCGTQWLAHWLAEQYADRIQVEHEPLHHQYQSNQLLAKQAQLNAQPIQDHLAYIEQVLQQKPYIEVGHPCWGAIPHLIEHFKDRIRIVHLVRHPVNTSFSWLTHGNYQQPLLPHLPAKIPLSPFDEGVQRPEYQERWETLTAFEKNLYYWTELNQLGLQLEQSTSVPWLRIQYEALFQGDDLKRLVHFLDLPEPEDHSQQSKQTVVDQFRYITDEWDDWQKVSQHPACIELAQQLGYTLDGIDVQTLAQRYRSY